ncbi:MAG: enoyl-CoA hydratase-related protein [Dehalococcoidia bacterium]
MAWSPWQRVPGFEFSDIIYEKKYHLEMEGGVARITINRPEVLNATTGHTFREMVTALNDASGDIRLGVVVLTGAGDNAFSSGGDVKWESTAEFRSQFDNPEAQAQMQVNDSIRKCRIPSIAAVKGYAIGAGNHTAYCCDFTIAADNAVFGQNGPRVASPAHGWLVGYLTNIVGAKKAREIWYLCRRYTAQQAQEMGLVNTVVPLDQVEAEVDKWCEELLSMSPTCIELLKASFDAQMDVLQGSTGPMGRLLNERAPGFPISEEKMEGPNAFYEKRQPQFWQKRQKRTPIPEAPRETVVTREAAVTGTGWRTVTPGAEVWG